jgi:hypothetical protein
MFFKWLYGMLPLVLLTGGQPVSNHLVTESSLSRFIEELFESRAQILINHNAKSILHYYLTESELSKDAYQHEQKRSEYLQAWAIHRRVNFTEAVSKIRIVRQFEQAETARISLVNTMQLTYQYLGDELVSQQFGLGTRHSMTLKKLNGQWHVYSEWYSDPLEEDPALISVVADHHPRSKPTTLQTTNSKYNRKQAIAYADKYAGGAWGAGNELKYNKRYRDYTYQGGDCTNFASQVIGDSTEGGGLKMTSYWNYQYKVGGSEAWIRTDSFKNFLVNRGYGRIIARGSFKELWSSSVKYPQGALASLSLGDLIAYEMKGEVDHFCILTGRDSRGYPLVNSHTSDRYHVPMDLGWDKYTKFSLIHIA